MPAPTSKPSTTQSQQHVHTDQTDQTAKLAKFMDSDTYQQMLRDTPTTYALIKKGHDLNPNAPALSFFAQATDPDYQTHETLSYAEFLAKLHQVGNFIDSLSLKDDAVIALLLPNLPEGYIATFGIQTRHIVLPINPMLEPNIISDLLNTAQVQTLITLAPFADNRCHSIHAAHTDQADNSHAKIWQKAVAVAKQVASLAHIVSINLNRNDSEQEQNPDHHQQLPDTITHHDWASALAAQPKTQLTFANDPQKCRNADDFSSFFCTGGTTGRPKIAMRQHKNEVANVLQTRATIGDDILGHGKTALCGLPTFHANALMVTGTLPLSVGGHVLLATSQGYRSSGMIDNFWKIIDYYQVNFFSGVPTLYSALLNVPIEGQNVSSLQYCLCGAAPMPVEVFNKFEAQTGITILEAYGMTEGSCLSSINPIDAQRKIGSIGQPVPFQPMTVVILDDAGSFVRHANVDEVGMIAFRGDNVFAGYYIDNQNANIWIEDNEGNRWLNTGDLGYQDSDGFLFLTGRKKELIIRGGHNIDPKSIEEPVYQHPSVALCAAIGKPDVYAGELPILYVQAKPDSPLDNAALQDYCQRHIGERAAIPKEIHLIDQIPLTPVGKVFKPALKRLANVASVEALLAEQNIKASITTPEHPKYGFITKVVVDNAKQLDEAQRLVAQLTIASEVTT